MTPSISPADAVNFAHRVLTWFDVYGRHDLPWQGPPDPYRIWVSEIMLQQTQVVTVIPYYLAFLERFPSVTHLAQAPLNDVLGLWSGLGYYARARNMHRAAQEIVNSHDGHFPEQFEVLLDLPGVGRSTAAAVAALSNDQPHAILDGNVKRVLSRYFALKLSPASAAGERQLWSWADALLPDTRIADYTQAMMDLGATVCTRHRPACPQCPLGADCGARQEGDPGRYPLSKPRAVRSFKEVAMLLVIAPNGDVWLQQRPPAGLWGGLWSFPELDLAALSDSAVDWCRRNFFQEPQRLETWPAFTHAFSHFELKITPVRLVLSKQPTGVAESNGCWQPLHAPAPGGIPRPVQKLLDQLVGAEHLLIVPTTGAIADKTRKPD